jgi:hypothetical protein
MVSAFVGGGGGMMTHRYPKITFNQTMCCPPSYAAEPYYKSSGYGVAAWGGQYRWRVTDLFSLGGEVVMNALFPKFAFNIDILADAVLTF